MTTKKKGWINVDIIINADNSNYEKPEVHVSMKPYATEAEAKTGLFHGFGIQRVGTFEIEWEVNEPVNAGTL